MNITTRTYYMPKNRISMMLINKAAAKVGCSIGELKIMKTTDTIRVPITCNENDVKRIEKILLIQDEDRA